jgi:serine/threonine protein kinase
MVDKLKQYRIVFPLCQSDLKTMLGLKKDSYEADREAYRALSRMQSIFLTLQQLHTEVGCHLDIKPQNILRKESGEYILGDFGTLMPNGECALKEVCYNEYCRHNEEPGRWSDVWSLATVRLELMLWISDGHDGVKNFRSRREFDQQHHSISKRLQTVSKTPWFNTGECLSPAVVDALKDMESKFPLQVPILRRMMEMKPEDRISMPFASENWEDSAPARSPNYRRRTMHPEEPVPMTSNSRRGSL